MIVFWGHLNVRRSIINNVGCHWNSRRQFPSFWSSPLWPALVHDWLGPDLLDNIRKMKIKPQIVLKLWWKRKICCNSKENKTSMKRSDRFVFQKLIPNLFQMSWIFRVPDTMIQAQIVFALSHWCEGLLAAALQYRQFLQILWAAAGWACAVGWAGSVWSVRTPENTGI